MEKNLRSILDEAQSQIELPHGVVRKDQGEAYLKANPTALPEDVLKSDIPLTIEFSIARLGRDDPAEAYLWAAVRSQSNVREGEAYLFPVFGRGRMLPAFSGKALNKQLVMKGCQYLLGECGCEVKEQNPGIYLLMSVDWDKAIDGTQVIQEMQLPPLEGALSSEGEIDESRAAEDYTLEQEQLWSPWSLLSVGIVVIVGCSVLVFKKRASCLGIYRSK